MRKFFLIVLIIMFAAPCCAPRQYVVEENALNSKIQEDILNMQQMILYLHGRIKALEKLRKLEWEQEQFRRYLQQEQRRESQKRLRQGDL